MKSLELEIFEKHFFMNRYKNESFDVIDTIGIFSDCVFDKINTRKFKVNKLLPEKNTKSTIIIYKIETQKRRTILYFLYPIEKCAIRIELRGKGKKVRAKLQGYGIF